MYLSFCLHSHLLRVGFHFFFLFIATLAAYGSSQTRAWIGAPAAAYATATAPSNSGHICDLCCSLHRILNPLGEARDGTCPHRKDVRCLTHLATIGTLDFLFNRLLTDFSASGSSNFSSFWSIFKRHGYDYFPMSLNNILEHSFYFWIKHTSSAWHSLFFALLLLYVFLGLVPKWYLLVSWVFNYMFYFFLSIDPISTVQNICTSKNGKLYYASNLQNTLCFP